MFPFNIKSLLRRAAAYEALERYRNAYIDYKTALQIDCNIAAAHDGTNRYGGLWRTLRVRVRSFQMYPKRYEASGIFQGAKTNMKFGNGSRE